MMGLTCVVLPDAIAAVQVDRQARGDSEALIDRDRARLLAVRDFIVPLGILNLIAPAAFGPADTE
ncbi:MAG: hypothetical protein ACLVAV_12785 [Clostridium sp.]